MKTFENIKRIIVEPSSWNSSEIEITLVFDDLISKNNYVVYIPKLHAELFNRKITLQRQIKILQNNIQKIIVDLNTNNIQNTNFHKILV